MEEGMTEKGLEDSDNDFQAWSLDQLTKSEFFHQKLRQWGLITVARKLKVCIVK